MVPFARTSRSGKFILMGAGAVGIQLLTASCVQRGFNPAQRSESTAKQVVTTTDPISGLERWDLALSFPEYDKKSELPDLHLGSLGMSDADFATILGHATNVKHLAPDADPLVSDDDPCFKKRDNWFVVAARFAPYELVGGGSPIVLKNWAATQGGSFDSAVQLRLTFRPFCSLGPNSVIRLDQAMHVVYWLQPEDAALKAKLDSGREWFPLAIAGKKDEANAKAKELVEAFGTPAYAKFRADIVREWAAVAEARRADGFTNALLESEGDKLLQTLMVNVGVEHVSESVKDVRTSKTYGAVKSFVAKHARQDQLITIAMMATHEGGQWFHSALTNNAGGLKPIPQLLTVDTEIIDGKINLIPIAMAEGASHGGLPNTHKLLPGVTKDKLLNVDVNNVARETLAIGDELDAQMRRTILDAEKTHFSTSACSSCHLLNGLSRDRGRPLHMPMQKYEFHMLGAGNINARTVAEITTETKRLKEEFKATSSVDSGVKPAPVFCKVTASDGTNVRRAPSGAVIGKAATGTGFMKIAVDGKWSQVQIRLDGPSSSLLGAGGTEPTAWIHESQFACP